jgi:predicted phage terminase large subunit-like protein
MTASLDWAEYAAQQFETKQRRWPTPGAMAAELDPLTRQTPALDVVDAAIVDTIDDDSKPDKVIICMAPQEGKSQRVTRRSPLWMLEHQPTLRIVIVSYDDDTAVRWGRQIKRDIEENPQLGLTVRQDSKAAGRWETIQGGSLTCVSINGAFTGKPADVLIIDDPVKDRAAAESALQRDRVWDFWENVAKVRSHKVILVLTRWHADDLAGRLLKKEPEDWRLVSIPAIAEDENDVLGRRPGEEMGSAQNTTIRPPGYFRKMMASASSYVWLSLFQQRPTLAEGNLFKRGDWRYWEPLDDDAILVDGSRYLLADCFRFITMDLATSTKTSADYTVACAWAITLDGHLALLDRVRERVPQTDHLQLLEPLRSRWLTRFDVTYIESRMFGSTLVYALGKKGLPIAELEADADKLTRALPGADLVKQHRVILPRSAPWLDKWLDEHAEFPNTKHDDQVDNTGYAARVALTRWLPMQSAAEEAARGSESDPDDVDLLTAAW